MALTVADEVLAGSYHLGLVVVHEKKMIAT